MIAAGIEREAGVVVEVAASKLFGIRESTLILI